MRETTYEGWVIVFESGTDYEADLVRDRLGDAGVPAVVLTQRDHAFNMTMGELARVHVLVPPAQAGAAQAVLDSEPFSDEELSEAAMNAAPVEDTHDSAQDAPLDSGIEQISFSVPPDEADTPPEDA